MQTESWLSGKVCVITGGNAGIGKATAVVLARLGAQIVLVGRDEASLRQTGELVDQEHPTASVRYRLCDLSCLRQVRELAAGLRQDFRKRSESRVVPRGGTRPYSATSWDRSTASSTVSQRLSAMSC